MRPVVVGTAGHVDHGKTALVKVLTGIDTDTLREEKRRGLSICAGFAPYRLSSGQQIAFVDVPGHERFVKNMVRGISGIDVAVLVVAADDGIMPQTREHFDILKLLDIKHGIVVLTKVDLVDNELIELAIEEIGELTRNTFLEDASCIRFSALTLEGKEQLENTLACVCRKVLPKNSEGVFCLPIDRSFHVRGFGTVVTGTIASGRIRLKDSIEVYPLGKQDTARFLQVHGESVKEAVAGQRVAINLPQVTLGVIRKGMVVGNTGGLTPTHIVNAEFHYLASQTKPLQNRTRVKFHTGAAETNGLMVFIEQEVINPGQTALVQFRLSNKVTPLPFDRYIVRCLSPVTTIGGGTVLEIESRKYRKPDKLKIDYLRLLVKGTEDHIIETAIKSNKTSPFAADELSVQTGISVKRIEKIIEPLEKKGDVVRMGKQRLFYRPNGDDLKERILKTIRKFHQKNPLKQGIAKQDIHYSHFRHVDQKLFDFLMDELEREGGILVNGATVHLAGFQTRLTPNQQKIKCTIERLATSKVVLNSTTLTNAFNDGEAQEAQDVISYLIRIGELIYIRKPNLQKRHPLRQGAYFHKKVLQCVKELVRDHIARHGQISMHDMKRLAGINASCSGVLLDYLDSIQFTLPVGKHRILRQDGGSVDCLFPNPVRCTGLQT